MEDHQETKTPSEAPGETPSGEHSVEAAEAEVAPDPLAQAIAERDRLRDKLLRAAADHDNFRKRTLREMRDKVQRAREDTLREILPVIDNLERAVSTSGDAKDVKTVVDGVRMVLKLFDDVGERMGLTRIATLGERFDPNVHDALQQTERDDVAPGSIVAELVPGYRVGERLLRPAMVVVAREPSGEPTADESDAQNASSDPHDDSDG